MAVVLLGAEDPEMNVTEAFLIKCGQTVVHATHQGVRVTPRTAYQADPVEGAENMITVECAIPGVTVLFSCDHHRPGDAGHGKGAEFFMSASSLGQVISALAKRGHVPSDWPICRTPLRAEVGEVKFDSTYQKWVVGVAGDYVDDEYVPGASHTRQIPLEFLLVAACDHCLADAWAGRCPGVSPNDVRDYREAMASTRPYDAKTPEQYRRDFIAALAACHAAPKVELNPGDHAPRQVRDVRGTTIPELPDAACYQGEAYLAEVTDRDGRRKIVLGGATTFDDVIAFRDQWAPAHDLTGVYAMPDRGIAGGYLS